MRKSINNVNYDAILERRLHSYQQQSLCETDRQTDRQTEAITKRGKRGTAVFCAAERTTAASAAVCS